MAAPALTTIFTPDRAVQAVQTWGGSLVRFLDRWDVIPKLVGRIDTDGSGHVTFASIFGIAATVELVDSNTAVEVGLSAAMADSSYTVLHAVGSPTTTTPRFSHHLLINTESFRLRSYSSVAADDLSIVARQFGIGVWGRLASGA